MEQSVHPCPAHSCATGVGLAQLLEGARVDAAIEAGLMEFAPCPACQPGPVQVIAAAQQQLRRAWAARDRYRVRTAREAERARAQAARRQQDEPGRTGTLPASAAAALARARAKASGAT